MCEITEYNFGSSAQASKATKWVPSDLLPPLVLHGAKYVFWQGNAFPALYLDVSIQARTRNHARRILSLGLFKIAVRKFSTLKYGCDISMDGHEFQAHKEYVPANDKYLTSEDGDIANVLRAR